jgi:hypothetical protein
MRLTSKAMSGFTIIRNLFRVGCFLAAMFMGSAAMASPVIQEALIIHADYLEYHGKRIPIPIKRESLIRAFGPPSREVYDAAGNVVIWDDLGLSCYSCQKPNPKPEELEYMSPEEVKAYKPNDLIGALTIYVRKYDPYAEQEKKYNHEPRFPFPGYVRLQGVDLNGSTSFEQFIADRNSKQTILLPDNSFSFYIRCKPAPQEITLYTIRDRYSDDYLNVYAVSIRNVGQFYKKLTCRENFETEEKKELEKKKLEEEQLKHPQQKQQMPLPVPAGEDK